MRKTLALVGLCLSACFDLDLPQQPVRSGVQGVVAAADSTPIEGVTVTLTRETDGEQVTLTTDAAGAFSSSGRVPGEWRLNVAHPGFFRVVRDLTLQPGFVKNLGVIRLESTVAPSQNDGQINGKVTVSVGDVTGAEVEFVVEATDRQLAAVDADRRDVPPHGAGVLP